MLKFEISSTCWLVGFTARVMGSSDKVLTILSSNLALTVHVPACSTVAGQRVVMQVLKSNAVSFKV